MWKWKVIFCWTTKNQNSTVSSKGSIIIAEPDLKCVSNVRLDTIIATNPQRITLQSSSALWSFIATHHCGLLCYHRSHSFIFWLQHAAMFRKKKKKTTTAHCLYVPSRFNSILCWLFGLKLQKSKDWFWEKIESIGVFRHSVRRSLGTVWLHTKGWVWAHV